MKLMLDWMMTVNGKVKIQSTETDKIQSTEIDKIQSTIQRKYNPEIYKGNQSRNKPE